MSNSHPLRPLEVVFVEDPHDPSDVQNIEDYERQKTRLFWRQAGRVCDLAGGIPPREGCPRALNPEATPDPCGPCPFVLRFFSWFPLAVLHMADGHRPDLIISDFVTNQQTEAPGNFLEDWASQPCYQAAAARFRAVTGMASGVVHGRDLMKAAWRLCDGHVPYIVFRSSLELPEERKMARGYVHLTIYGDDWSISEALRQVIYHRQEITIKRSISMPFPTLEWAEAMPEETGIVVDFAGAPPHVRLVAGRFLPLGSPGVRLTKSRVLPFAGGGGGASKGHGGAASLRHLIRMDADGVAASEATIDTWGKALRVKLKSMGKEDSETHAALEFLQRVCVSRRGDTTLWASSPCVRTSAEEAFRAIYHATLSLAVMANSDRYRDRVRGALQEGASEDYLPLRRDTQLLSGSYIAGRTEQTARSLIDFAGQRGQDAFSTELTYCDLEMLFMPDVLRLCLGKLESPSSDVRETAEKLHGSLFQCLCRDVTPYAIIWGLSEQTLELARLLGSVAKGEPEAERNLLRFVFHLYADGRSWYRKVCTRGRR